MRRIFRRTTTSLLLTISVTCLFGGEFWREEGALPITNFSPQVINASPQSWSLTQDSCGLLYVGNNGGLLQYDGTDWRLIPTHDVRELVRGVYTGTDGVVYVSGINNFGYLANDSLGFPVYHSLSRLHAAADSAGDIWSVREEGGRILFQSSQGVFVYGNGQLEYFASPNPLGLSFQLDDQVFYYGRNGGLFTLEGSEFELLPGSDFFASKGVYGLAYSQQNGKYLVATNRYGLFWLDQQGEVKAIKNIVQSLSEEYPVYSMQSLGNGVYCLGTLGGGLVFMDEEGNVRRMLNKTGGLQDDAIYCQFIDRQKQLWLGTSNGLSRIEFDSPFTHFNSKAGLDGTVEAVTRFNDQLYVATQTGVYNLQRAGGDNFASIWLMDEATGGATFSNESGINTECWDVLNFGGKGQELLLVSSNDGIYQINAKGKVKLVNDCLPWKISRSLSDSQRVYIAMDNGLGSMRKEGRNWTVESGIPQVRDAVYDVVESNSGDLWLTRAAGSGVLRVSFSEIGDTAVALFDTLQGLPDGQIALANTSMGMMFGTRNGVYSFVEEQNRFERLNIDLHGAHVHRIQAGMNGRVWLSTVDESSREMSYQVMYLEPSEAGELTLVSEPFLPLANGIIHAIDADTENVTWIGGPEGLYRYDQSQDLHSSAPFQVWIRKVVSGRDSVLSYGGISVDNRQLRYADNSLTFDFSSPYFKSEGAIQYQYQLVGFDKQWSDWKNTSKAVYTNLYEGDYQFQVRAKNIFDQHSTIATYTFSIEPPFYRTAIAYLLYLVAAVLLVYLIVSFSTRRLKLIIKSHTQEILQQKEVIEAKNQDITDSINYAKKIQDSFLPSEKGWRELLPNSFAILRPKDIVSGDFKWITGRDGYVFFTAADCTGHGVPGAFMSMVGTTFLNQAVKNLGILETDAILNEVRSGIIQALRANEESQQKDGMDLALCRVNLKTGELMYSGANNPLWLIRKGEAPLKLDDGSVVTPLMEEGEFRFYEIKGNKQPVGYHPDAKPFIAHSIQLNVGTDAVYVFSDGYADQFGGKAGKKFKTRNFKKLLLSIQGLSIDDQSAELVNQIEHWRGSYEQVDDICVIGWKY